MTTSGGKLDQHNESQRTREEEEQDGPADALVDSEHGGIVSHVSQRSRTLIASFTSPEGVAGRMVAFGLHTVGIYICAVHVSPWLVGRWFAWFMPIMRISTARNAGDWYLQHLELMTIIPALVAGHVIARQRDSVATLAWAVPSLVLAYRMLLYPGPSSVLVAISRSAVRYFFEIEKVMPSMRYATGSDPVRVLAQMMITAPFYAGVAYSFGAWTAKRGLIVKLLSFTREAERG